MMGSILIAIAIGDITAWAIWDSNHIPGLGILVVLVGIILTACGELNEGVD
jgi:hypothetical protein